MPPPPPPGYGAAPPPPPGPGSPPPGGKYGGYDQGGGGVSENRQLFLVLAYLGPLALLPFFMEKNDREVIWHAKHGLVLTGLEILLGIVAGSIAAFTCIGCLVGPVFFIGVLGLHVTCIVKALNGQRLIIPGISPLADQF